MAQNANEKKESEIQATSSPAPDENVTHIAPQGYEADFIEEIAEMETPAQKRRKLIRYFIFMILFCGATIYFCTPNDPSQLPSDTPIPYGLENRPLPPTDKFLHQVTPRTLGDYKLIDQQEERLFEDPFVGEDVLISTYINSEGTVATIWIINAQSYINTKRFLNGLKDFLTQEAQAEAVIDYIWQEHNFLQWDAPQLANRAYGFAWSKQHFYYSVTSASPEARDFFAENFPY